MTNTDDLAITLGVEEECFLVDPRSRNLLADPDPGIFDACEKHAGPHKVVRELLRAQVEINTRVCASVAEVDTALRETRRLVIEAAGQYGTAVMAASTHPFAVWQTQLTTPKERYQQFTITYQETLRRFLAGGMHIHAGFGDPDSRIRGMTALRRYLPPFHALSGSSPFDSGSETGFKSFRLNIIGTLPRTGLPGPLHSRAEFDRLLADYQRLQFLTNGSELWWDIRPSHAYPTVELRICDVCTRIEDAVCTAALYASLIRWLLRKDRDGGLPPEPPTEIIAENRWQAQRYGVFAFLADSDEGTRVDIQDYTAKLVEEIAGDAQVLGCENEVRHALTIIREGAGADRQVDHYRLCRLEGATKEEALRAVVDRIIAETWEGTGADAAPDHAEASA